MANANRKCCGCKERFPSDSMIRLPVGYFHSVDCSIQYANKKTAVKSKKVHAKQKRDFYAKDKPFRAKAAQKAFNAFIRARDTGQPCISCQRHHSGQYHAGHYKTAGGNPELKFEELNCHLQCSPCNNHLSGNIGEYRKNLIIKIGLSNVEWLEGPHELKRYSAQDYKEIETEYKEKMKSLVHKSD